MATPTLKRISSELTLPPLASGRTSGQGCPQTTTFRSRDTFAGDLNRPTSLNRYQYAGNNPIRHWDPTGNDYEFYGDEGPERAVDQIGLLSESAFQQLIAEATKGRAKEALAILSGPGVAPASVVEVQAVQESIVSNSTSVSEVDWGNYTLVAELIDSPMQPDGSLGESYLRTVPHHEVYRAVVESVQLTKNYQGTDSFANFLGAVTPLEAMTTSCFNDLWSASCGMNAGFTLGGPLLSRLRPGPAASVVDDVPVSGVLCRMRIIQK